MHLKRWRKAWEDKEWFFNRPTQLLMLGFFSLVVMIELYVALADEVSPTSRASRGFALAIALAAGAVGCRSLLAPSIEVNSEHLVLRDIHRTRRLMWHDIASVEVVAGNVGMSPAKREYLVLHLNNGTTRRFTGLNAPVRRDEPPDPRVRDALKAIQRQLRIHQRI